MLSIGPYVVVREIPTRTHGTPGSPAGKTYRATDRLTGIPVLLHHLAAMSGVPRLPAHPALLPFTDIVVHAGEAFLVTELPPNAVPARDPVHAARGALAALSALHGHGLAHGGVDTAQLWSVDGPVRLAGGGRFELGGDYTPARDLRDLARTLDDLGGLPPILSLLRTEPERLSAREALELLQTGEAPPEPAPAGVSARPRGVRFAAGDPARGHPPGGLPNLDPLSLLNPSAPLPQTPSFVSQAVLTSAQEPGRSNTDPGVQAPAATLPFTLDISQWDVPDFMEGQAAVTPVSPQPAQPSTTPTVSLGWQAVTRPLHPPAPEVTATPDLTPPPPEDTLVSRQGRRARAAASQALHRLKSDGQRLRAMQEARRDEVAAQLGALEGLGEPDPVPSSGTLSSDGEVQAETPHETPQERRRREHQARVEEQALASQLEEKRGPVSRPAAPPVSEQAATQAATVQGATARPRKSVKMRWDERTGTWQRAQEAAAPKAGATLPRWMWPLLALMALLALFLGSRVARSAQARGSQPPTASACCTVDFRVTGGGGQATIRVLNSTSRGEWRPGQVVGQAPGALKLPGEGTYKLSVTSEGYTPATLDVTLPRSGPVTINLGP